MSERADATDQEFWADADGGRALQRYRTLVNAVDNGIYQLDADGRFLAVNDAILELTGYTREELLGEPAALVLDDGDRIEREIRDSFERDEHRTEPIEITVRTAADEAVPCELTLNPLVEEETLQGAVGIVRDVGDRTQTKRELHEREAQLERERSLTDRIIEASHIGIVVLDSDGEILRINERGRELLDVEDAERYDPSDRPVYDENGTRIPVEEHPFAQTLATGEPVSDRVLRVERPGGSHRWLSVNAKPVLTDDGEIDRVVTTGKDVTALKERERRLERRADELSVELDEIYGRITDGVMALDREWTFTHANERAGQILAVESEELLGMNLWETFPDIVGTSFEDRYREAMETQESVSFEEYHPPDDTWYEEHVYPSETGLSIYFRDVTERKDREQELELFRNLLDHSTDSIMVIDPETGAFVDVNETACRRHGYSREEFLQLTVPDVETELPDHDAWRSFVEELRAEGEAIFDGYHRREDGAIYPVEVNVTFVELEREYVVAIARDVTERKEFEGMLTGLHDSSRLFLSAETKADISEIIVDTASNVLDLPCVACYQHDPDRDVLVPDAHSVDEAFPAQRFTELRPDGTSRTAQAFEAGELYRYDAEAEPPRVQVNSGETEMRSGLFVPMGDHGVVVAGACTTGEIDDKQQQLVEILATNAQSAYDRLEREQYVRDAKEQLEAATEAGAVGTWEWQIPEDRFVTGSTLARTFGVDPEAATEGVSLDQFVSAIHEDDRERIRERIEDAIQSCGEYESEYRVWNDEGDLRWVVARGHVECDEDGNPVTFPGTLVDITERKRAEQELQRHKRQLESLFELLPVAVVVADADGRLVEANETAREIWGGDVFDAETVADYEQYNGWWADTGEPVDPDEWTLARVLEGEEVTEPDICEIETTDGERRTVMLHGMPIRDASGEISHGVITQTDITERRQYRRQLEESNERLEQFAYAASHDLQEPLRMVSSYLQLIENRYGDDLDEEGQEFIGFAVDGAERMNAMIEGLLEYSRVETQGDPFEPTELDEVLAAAKQDLEITIDESDAEITAATLPRVEGDSSQLRQLFQNLLDNAIEYSGDEPPRIHVSAERCEARSPSKRSGTAAENDGPAWVVSVRDGGIGIHPDDADRIFEVFQRLHSHEDHDGTGIGLALCKRIVERHDGEIWVDSEPGEGTTFSFRLPAA
ncbi:PAS domain-containing sensor histidine kinase [Natronococcus pandeyae]|uniref:histidine kinase n=1 Tax=Natronococcus pandeyae TaxID=2055836 RepID=A0A8J8Q2M2_9EURY|nr:PAS domain S-box protein [Natronococcus pandeyae]TYL37782.1 PAS domain-containing sensor histidine kinase [Natronococcus pandeyae]